MNYKDNANLGKDADIVVHIFTVKSYNNYTKSITDQHH